MVASPDYPQTPPELLGLEALGAAFNLAPGTRSQTEKQSHLAEVE